MKNYLIMIDRLISDEGYRAHPYKDTMGVWTIGHGSTRLYTRGLKSYPVSKDTAEMPRWEARRNLIIYVDTAITIAREFVKNFDMIGEVRQCALTMMAYQMGYGLHEFNNTRFFIESGAHGAAADEMLDSLWATKQSPERAKRTALIYKNNEWI
jgi:GH24 family phage-related lysozyme (muramidase)